MDPNYEDILLLERYLEHTLSDAERRSVEGRLQSEPALRDLLNSERLLINGIRYSHLLDKFQQLKTFEKTLPHLRPVIRDEQKQRLRMIWKPLAVAATVALVALSFWWWNRPVDPSLLFAEYFQPYPNIIEPTVRGSQQQNERAEAVAAYERSDYESAARGFTKILSTSEKPEPGILLLLGNANLSLSHVEEARANFITLSKEFDIFDMQAKWFLSMCYLKMRDKRAAQVILEDLAGGDSSYNVRARELLEKIN